MNQKHVAIAIFLAVVVVGAFFFFGMFGVGGSGNQTALTSGPQEILEELAATGRVSSLKVYDLVVGEGKEAVSGANIVVHYTGVLPDGTVFDSSLNRGEPFVFTLGAGQVIQGWDRGFSGMREGGRRLLAIPAELGYGSQTVGTIPPNSTLIFEVELLQVLENGAVEEGEMVGE